MSTEPANTRGLIGSWRLRMLLQLLRSLQRTWPDFRGCTYDPVTRTLDLNVEGVGFFYTRVDADTPVQAARRMR